MIAQGTLLNNENGKRIWKIMLFSCVWLFAIPWTTAPQTSLSFTISKSLLKFMFIELVMRSNHLVLCHPLLLPSVFPSIRVFSNELALHIRWLKYWSFSFIISSPNEYLGLISFRIDWLDLPSVQEMFKSLLQHHNSERIISLVLRFLYELNIEMRANYKIIIFICDWKSTYLTSYLIETLTK